MKTKTKMILKDVANYACGLVVVVAFFGVLGAIGPWAFSRMTYKDTILYQSIAFFKDVFGI